jgi:hypothetical protein
VEVLLGIVVQVGVQLRLPCIVPAGGGRGGKDNLQLPRKREKKIGPEMFTLSGHSVFYENAQGEIFGRTGTFGRGSERFMGVYGYFDVLPKGRQEYVNGLVD